MAEFDDAIRIARTLRSREMNLPNECDAAKESMDSVVVELGFLSTLLGYVVTWSDGYTAANMDSLVIKLVAEAKAIKKELHAAFLDYDSDQYFTEMDLELTDQLAAIWRKVRHCCGSDRVDLFRVFSHLEERIGFLKPHIREALESFDTNTSQLQPYHRRISVWVKFSDLVNLNLQFLLDSSCLPSPLAERMGAFKQSLDSFRFLLQDVRISGEIWIQMKAHFGEVVIRSAHLSCFCWYAQLDLNIEKEKGVLLENLHQEIELTSLKFLDMILAFLGLLHDDAVFNRYAIYFVNDMLGAREDTFLHQELMDLMILLHKNPEEHRVEIKDALMEAAYLKNKDHRGFIADVVGLFARVLFIKADIFAKCESNSAHGQSLKGRIEAIFTSFEFMIESFASTGNKTGHQILKLVREVPEKVNSLHQSSEAGKGYKVRDVLYKFLVKMSLFKAKALVLKLLNDDASLMLPLKPRIGALHEGLLLMVELDFDEEQKDTEEKQILMAMQELAATVKSLISSFSAAALTEEAVQTMEPELASLVKMVQQLKTKLKELYLTLPILKFPKVPSLSFFEHFHQNLRQPLSWTMDSVAFPTHQIGAVREDMGLIITYFRNVMEKGIENQAFKVLLERLLGLVHEAQYVIDWIVVEKYAPSQYVLWLHHLSEEIRRIRMQLSSFSGNTDVRSFTDSKKLMPVASRVPSIEEVMVGLHDEKDIILNRLTRGTRERDIVSIVGMPGIGKTTIANNVFCSLNIAYHFHIRAWCSVSQTYRKRDLLLEIISHIVKLTDDILAKKDEDLEDALRKHLKGKTYLIVMDDMWSPEAWEELQTSFPNDSVGSRILITSRLHDVVPNVRDPLMLRLLTADESWELLQKRIFHGETCPEELLEVGQKIAESCKGLPLAIGAVAGILDRMDKKQDRWKEFAESVCSRIVNDPQTQCMDILELSYNHLPDHLKACLLYFGAFPEDKDIPAQRLLWLWIAEGFILRKDSKSLEDVAEDYLMDLVGRSLVIVSKRRSNGAVKACRVHDLVRDMCLLKGKADTFMQLITTNDEPYSSFDGLGYFVHHKLLDPLMSQTYGEQHRLSFCLDREHFVAAKPSGPYVRSLLFFAANDMYPRCPPYDVSFISNNFKLLKVLDLESINMGHTLEIGFQFLVHLTLLSISGDMDSIPSSLSNLKNLQVLVVRGLKRLIVLPHTLWNMRKLRHLHVTDHATFTLLNEQYEGQPQLHSLLTLSFASFLYGEETDNVVQRFPNLRKLKCTFVCEANVSMDLCHFPRLESLHQLESLRISHHGRVVYTGELHLPSNLKKLTLSNFGLPWNRMSAVGRLPNLEVLKLISRAFEGSSWKMTEDEFQELKYLALDTLRIVKWEASSNHLPQLKYLVIKNCKQLEEVPFDFSRISTLLKIEVQQCGSSVDESIKLIKEEVVEGLKVVINNSA